MYIFYRNLHTKDAFEACSSKFSYFLSSRFPRHHLGFQSYCSKESFNTSETSDVSAEHQSLNISDSICVESPDVATYSEVSNLYIIFCEIKIY